MSVFAFATYEVHPTTPGGCGVFVANAAHHLLEAGHEVVLLLDLAEREFKAFRDHDRLSLPGAERCRAYRVEELADASPLGEGDFHDLFAWKSFLFERASRRLVELEKPDVLEFFDYCGVGHAALSSKAGGVAFPGTHLAVRLHTSIEVLDAEEPTHVHGEDRYGLFALEHAALRIAETVLYPSERYLRDAYRPRYGSWWGNLVPSPPPLRRVPSLRAADGDADVALFFGRLFTLKGADLFVDAAVQLLEDGSRPTLRFVLAGYDLGVSPEPGLGYAEFLLRRIPRRHRDRFEFTGQIGWDRLEELSPRIRFAVFPSRFESFCYAAHELAAAGVPVIVSDLPAFRDHFRDGETALFAGAGTPGLAEAMSRLNGDDVLRERLAGSLPERPRPLGGFYDEPAGTSWMDEEEPSGKGPPHVLVCVLGGEPEEVAKTEASLERSGDRPDATVRLVEASGTDETGRLSFLGGSWVLGAVRSGDPDGDVVPRTLDLLLVLRAGDELDPRFLGICRRALHRHARLGFVGAFKRLSGHPGFDTACRETLGELAAFGALSPLSRCVVRTAPGLLLPDVFDPRAGALGEVLLLWELESGGRPGLTVPEILLRLGPEPAPALEPRLLSYLVVRDRNEERARRLARLSVVSAVRKRENPGTAAGLPPEGWKRRVIRALSRRGATGRKVLASLRELAAAARRTA